MRNLGSFFPLLELGEGCPEGGVRAICEHESALSPKGTPIDSLMMLSEGGSSKRAFEPNLQQFADTAKQEE
jgi:hypothetical protein